jgi:hypothetical protein
MDIAIWLWVALGGLVGAAIGTKKNRTGGGFVLGLLLGPIGWLLVAVGPDLREKGPTCPHCGGEMAPGKAVCRHCGREVSEQSAATTSALVGAVLLTTAMAHLAAPPVVAQDPPPAPPIIAQHYVPTPKYQEIEPPMLLEVSMGATDTRKSVKDMDSMHAWVTKETGAYACKGARVRLVQVWKEEHHGKVQLRVLPDIMSDARRQDVDVVVAIVSSGKVVAQTGWKDLTVGDDNSTANKLAPLYPIAGAFGSSSKSPEARFEFPEQAFAAMFEGGAPSVRVILTPKDDD